MLDELEEKIHEKINVYTQDSFSTLLNSLLESKPLFDNVPSVTDSHFRIGFEDSSADYADLYENFLFSYSLFLEWFEAILVDYIKETDIEKKSELAANMIDMLQPLLESKALVHDFAVKQFSVFLQRYFFENPTEKVSRSF